MLIKNATVWSGENDGNEVWKGDVLLDKGLIKWVGGGEDASEKLIRIVEAYGMALDTTDAKGLWLTPGYEYTVCWWVASNIDRTTLAT